MQAGFVDPESGIAVACLVNQLSHEPRVAADVLRFVAGELGAGEFAADGMSA